MKCCAYALPVVMMVLVTLSACGTIGEKDFACPGRPPGVRCMSASEVYRATHYADTVEPTASRALGDEPQRSSNSNKPPQVARAAGTARVDRGKTSRERPAVQHEARPTAFAVDRPIPIRTPAQVMRVWIAPWEDVRGVLHGGEHAFIEIVARRWSVGEREATEPVRFFSLQAPNEPARDGAEPRKPAAGSGARPERLPSHPSSTKGESP